LGEKAKKLLGTMRLYAVHEGERKTRVITAKLVTHLGLMRSIYVLITYLPSREQVRTLVS
jgi:hypothetical protein